MASDSFKSFITSRPQCDPCPRCGRLVLTGHAEGLTYKVDPIPATAHTELTARQAGRASYALIADTLAARTPSRIHGDTVRGRPPVLITHHCTEPPDAAGVDATHVATVSHYLDRIQRREAVDLTAPVSDTEHDTLALIGHELGGRVVEFEPTTNPEPPF